MTRKSSNAAMPPDCRVVVLVVDASEERRAEYFTCLTFVGFRVLEADHARAVHRARVAQPDAIVLDASVPGSGVWETARLIKSDPKTKDAFLIALAADNYHERARGIGVDVLTASHCQPYVVAELVAKHRGMKRLPRR